MGFDPYNATMEQAANRTNPFQHIYIQLRNRAQAYINSGVQPALELQPHPTGNFDWQVSLLTITLKISILTDYSHYLLKLELYEK